MSFPAPFYVCGPTGCGKSAVALELAEMIGGEIVNADAFQLYDVLRTLSARPEPEDESRVPHHLYGVVPPNEKCDAGRYLELALPVLAEIQSRVRVAVVTGGSGLYIKALTHGMTNLPAPDASIRLELESLDEPNLRDRLRRIDPASESAILPGNRRYLQRAIEITLSSGTAASQLRQSWRTDSPDLRGVFLNRLREELFRRIDDRVVRMFTAGAVAEVREIENWSETASKAIGVGDIQRLIRGEVTEVECVASIQQASRRYAKRQLTWFRRERWLDEIFIPEDEPPRQTAERIVQRCFPGKT